MKCTRPQQHTNKRRCVVSVQTCIHIVVITFCTIILLLSHASPSLAQANLVLNPSFEVFTQCPTGADQINRATHWSAIDSTGSVGPCWPEFAHACSIYGAATVPLNAGFYQFPRTGQGLAQLQVFYDESTMPAPFDLYRDYLQGRLSTTLTAGTRYCVSFYVNVTETSYYGIDRIGAYLDDGSIDAVNNCGLPQTQFTPQVEYTGGVITDTFNWIKVEGSFIASGTERFITIGNFYSKASTTYTVLPGTNNNNAYGWLLIDDVSVIPMDISPDVGNDTLIYAGDTARIGIEPQQVLPYDYKWFVDATLVGSGPYMDVSPSVTTTYRLEQTICDSTLKDTVTVSVVPVEVSVIENERVVSIYPNPVAGSFQLVSAVPFSTITIIDGIGRKMKQMRCDATDKTVDISFLPAGMYYLLLEGSQGVVRKKFSKL